MTCFLVLLIMVQIIRFLTRPRVEYSLARADCSATSIAERNHATGGTDTNCILIVTAKNLGAKRAVMDWNGVGGGPFARRHPQIRINTGNGGFCYAGTSNPDALGPYESRNLDLQCFTLPQKVPKGYDEHSDQNPQAVVISDPFDTTTLLVTPHR